MDCPKCESWCWRESADIGVGVIYGPYGCPVCGWSEWKQYDQTDSPDPHTDQWGGYYLGNGENLPTYKDTGASNFE